MAIDFGVTPRLASSQGFTYSGVGFQNYSIAGIISSDMKGSAEDAKHYKVTIDWGDGTKRDDAHLDFVKAVWDKPGHGYPLAVKGSHTYFLSTTTNPTQPQHYGVDIYISHNGATPIKESLGRMDVYWMTYELGDTQSITRTRQGTEPVAPSTGKELPGYVHIDATKVNSASPGTFSANIYKPVTDTLVGWIDADYNGKPNVVESDYTVQIDWGDGSGWEKGSVKQIPGNKSRLEVRGTKEHPYCIPGLYEVHAYITGPDNTSMAYHMGDARVSSFLPDPRPGKSITYDLNQRILHYLAGLVGDQIGSGECTDAIIEALRVSGGRFDLHGQVDNWTWGTPVATINHGVATFSGTVKPGDIIQYYTAKTDTNLGGKHTAVVGAVANGLPTWIYEQNTSHKVNGKWVDTYKRVLYYQDRTWNFTHYAGQITIYHPDALGYDPETVRYTVVNKTLQPVTTYDVVKDLVTGKESTPPAKNDPTEHMLKENGVFGAYDIVTFPAWKGNYVEILRLKGSNDPGVVIEDGAAYEVRGNKIYKLDGCSCTN